MTNDTTSAHRASSGRDDKSSDLSVALQVDSLCDAFELSWKEGQRPDLKSYLETTNVPGQTLFVELVLIDITYRQKSGETPSLEEYASQFPEYSHALQDITIPVAQSKQSAADVSVKVSEFQRLGHYELREQIGEGSFGVVWKAWNLKLHRWAALKKFREVNSDTSRKLLAREARAVASIDHPNVVRVYEVGDHLEGDYVAFEYVSGGTLSSWMKNQIGLDGRSTITPEQAAAVALQLARGLNAVHEQGVIHRDFKPGNVLQTDDGVLKIVDFGLARHADAHSTIGGDGLLMGTIPYMSPEQCLGNRGVTAASDVYSLGVILYEMLTGQRPLQGSRVELLDKIQNERPLPPSQLTAIPASLENICLRAIEKDPRDRYSSAAEMQTDLEAFLAGQDVPRYRPPLWRSARRVSGSKAIAAVSVMMMLGGFGAFLASSPTSTADERKVILLDSTPSGAKVAMIPLDPNTGIPLPQNIVHAAGRTPLKERLVGPGDYLVEVYLEDGSFHEVYRHVPEDKETLSGYGSFLGWRREKSDFNSIRLASVDIPQSAVAEEMALVTGTDQFQAGIEGDPILIAHDRNVPSFYIDPTEVPVSVNQKLFERVGEPDQRWTQPPTLQHAWCTKWLTALWVAEKLGKRLPDEFEYEYAATNAGTRKYSWGDESAPVGSDEKHFLPVGQPVFDQVMFDRPVYGLCSNVAEWTSSWVMYQYPQRDPSMTPAFLGYAAQELRVVRGGDEKVINGDAAISGNDRDPRHRSVQTMHQMKPGLGFRCARSLKPRLTPEDFGHATNRSQTPPAIQ